ncbi:MAG: tetratricopeptide repeat protein, partial [Cyanobacteria bacterium J06659_2]
MYRQIMVIATLMGGIGIGASGAFATQPGIVENTGAIQRETSIGLDGLSIESQEHIAQLLLAQADDDDLSDEEKARLGELLREAQDLIDDRDYASAIAAYQQATQIDGDNPRIYSGIGYLQIQQGNYQAAAAAYRQAIDLDPRNLPFRHGLAFSLVNAGSLQEATAVYQELIRMAPTES